MTVVDIEEETAEVIELDVEAVVIEADGLASVKPITAYSSPARRTAV